MVDKIEKVDSGLYRVQESLNDQGGRGRQPQEEEEKRGREKDEFDKGKPFWKKLISSGSAPGNVITRKVPGANLLQGSPGESQPGEISVTEEMSLSLSQRVLVMWGVVDLKGKPRIPVIATYVVVLTVIGVATLLMVGVLWR